MFRDSVRRDVIFLLLVCSVVFWWRLGSLGLIDPDEPFYAQTAREMVATGDWVTPQIFGHAQFEKPILFYWLTAASFKVFGESEFSARVSSALPATILVWLVYGFGIGFCGRRAALFSALVLATGLEFAIMSRLMLTDIALALFIAGALFSYWRALEDEKHEGGWIILHFICGGLVVLTKGPFGSLVTVLAIAMFAWLMRRRNPFRGRALWIGLFLWFIIGWPWFIVMQWKYGMAFFDEFFIHDNWDRLIMAEHPTNNRYGLFLFYYVLILVGGSLPWIPAVVVAIRRACRGLRSDPRQAFLWSWIITSFVFLTIAQSKLPSYIFYVFVPLAMVVGIALDDLMERGFRDVLERRLAVGFACLQIVLAVVVPPFVKVARPFLVPAFLLGACLIAGMYLAWRRKWGWSIGAHVAATAALIMGALTFSQEHVDEVSSARPVAQAMMEGRVTAEPLLSGSFLARGIHYYTREPVKVLANGRKQPFWSPHPLDTVNGRKDLEAFVAENGPVRLTVRRSEWESTWKKSPLFAYVEPQWFGDNGVVRVVPLPAPPAASPAPLDTEPKKE